MSVSGLLKTTGSPLKSRNANEYIVSALGLTINLSFAEAGGLWLNWLIGAPFSSVTFVEAFDVKSIITNGSAYT